MAYSLNIIGNDHIQTPQDLFVFCRDELTLGVKKSKHPFHQCTFCSVMNNRPFSRTVVSRGMNHSLTECRIHSDRRSQKNHQLMSNPNVSLVYYSQQQRLQVRFEGIASLLTDQAQADPYFYTSSHHSQQCYAYSMPPGAPIQERTKEERYPEISVIESEESMDEARKNFSVICITIHTLDALWLSKQGHIRIQGTHNNNDWDLKFVVA